MPRIKSQSNPALSRDANRRGAVVTRGHPDDARLPGTAATAHRIVSINLKENPLSWLYSRGLLNDRQLAAGDQLRGDYTRAGLAPNVTMNWDAPPRDGTPRAARSNDGGTIAMIDAKARFHAAMAAVGPGLGDICWRVVCGCEAMTLAERELGWPNRAGRVVLGLALDRLADFYRIG